jgi:hypothetical protein
MAAAELLIMPSYFESLSMVALEAWALGRPVLANGSCDVLKGQSLRSNAGLYYDGAMEFVETLRAIEQNRWLSASLGRNGRQFFREQYDWPVIERKYVEMLDRLSKEPAPGAMDPLPGWLARRRQDCRPGAEVVAALPAGPQLRGEISSPSRPGPSAPAPIPGPSAAASIPGPSAAASIPGPSAAAPIPRPAPRDRGRHHQRSRPGGGTPGTGSA